jgi:hypothetical protein
MIDGYICLRKNPNFRPLAIPRPRCANKINVGRRAVHCEAINWLKIVVVTVLLQFYVKTGMNI